MEYKKTSFKKRFAAFALVVSFIIPVSYSPIFTPRAEAILGVGDINLESIPTIVKFALEQVGTAMAQRMVDDMVKETIKWANSGFEDNPAFVTDFDGFLIDTADRVAGQFLQGSDLDFLCSPFKTSTILTLRSQYNLGAGKDNTNRFQCTFSEAIGNADEFFDGKFNEGGGWNAWFAITQDTRNNPYGAYLGAKIELDSRIARELNVQKTQLNWSSGVLSWSECVVWDGETGKCLTRGDVKTPGSVIHEQLNNSLGSGMARLISADSLNDLVSAFAQGLLQRYVFGEGGLFNRNTSETIASGREMIDLDGDNIPEGWDYNSDGQLDICHHGLVNQSQKPSNANCVRSEGAGSTPFFIPICEALRDAIHETEDYREFIFANNFEEIYSNTWLNRTLSASASVERFESTLSRFKLMEYDPALFALGEFLKEFQKRIENLSADGRLHTNKRLAKDEDAGKALGRLRRNTTNVLAYMEEFQAKIGRCESPDTTTTSRIPPPVIEAEPPPPAQIPPGLEGSSCSASPENVQVGGTVVWTAYTSLTSPTYLWAGTGINSATTKSASTSYSSAGTQIASVTITGIDIEGEEKTGTILCANQVTVTGPTNPPGGEDGGPGDEPL